MVLETHRKRQDRRDGMGPSDVRPLPVEGHPSDLDLLGWALGELDGPIATDVDAHLTSCFYCHMRLNRIRRRDPRLDPPRNAPPRPRIPEEILLPLVADPPGEIKVGQVWLVGERENEQIMVWIRSVRPRTITAHPVTLDVDYVDDLSLIVELPVIERQVSVVSSLIGTVPRKNLVAHLGDLDIEYDLRQINEAAHNGTPTDLRTGLPVANPNDERDEFRQMLADDLAAIDPIIDTPDDEDDDPVLAGAPGVAGPGTG